ncbi:RNA recognition domain-containing protein [Xylariales sp. AK1849]|nr:RNA recognition domain-containing protein [Xylariales sp. AK1849]
MATAAMDYETAEGDRYEDEGPRYDRDQRSASPRPARDDGHETRRRSASPINHADRVKHENGGSRDLDDDGAINPGSNLFVTGIHPKLTEGEVTRLFEKYGEVEKCQIMRDPHTKESRGFGFVKMVTSDQADAAKDGLQGEVIEGRTLSIEKARRARPRTPTPGKYFGPPKREGERGDRFEDRRRGGRGGYGGGFGGGRRDDPYRYRGGGSGGYERRDYDRGGDRSYREDRGYDRGYREDRGGHREDRGYDRRDRDDTYTGSGRGGGVDRYGGRDDREARYGGSRGGDDRRDRGYERGDRDGPRSREPAASGYGDSGSRPDGREAYGGGAP